MIRRLVLLSGLLSSAACVLPRSALLGQTAAGVGAGNAEAAVSAGLAFQADSTPPTTAGGTTTVQSTQTLWAPGLEGNAQVGFTDWLGLNVHLSNAGIQPGVKLTVLSGGLSLAILPELAFGYASQSAGTTTTTGGTSKTNSGNTLYYFSFLAGAKVLASHSSGFYGGLGYDFQALSTSTVDNKGFNQGSVAQQASIVSLAVGYNFQVAAFAIRPEVAMLILPSNTNTTTAAGSSNGVSLGGGSGFVFFPNVTFAVASGKSAAKQPEPMQLEELSLPPLIRTP